MTDELPRGWATSSFMDVFDIQGGTQPPKKTFKYEPTNGYVRLLQIRDFGEKPVPTFIREKSTLKTCQKDDVLIGRYGASVGRICTGMEGAYNVALAKVVIPPQFDRRFVFHLLRSPLFQRPILDIERSAQDGFNKEDLSEIAVPIPPSSEQHRIVTKLDKVLGKVDACQKRLVKIPALLKRFRQSILAAACSGRLTADWREENPTSESVDPIVETIRRRREAGAKTNAQKKKLEEIFSVSEENESSELPDNWRFVVLNKLCSSFDYGTSAKSQPAGKVPVLRMGNIQHGKIDWMDLAYTSDADEIASYSLKPNTVLFNRTNSPELVGKTAIYRGERPAIFAGYIIRINPFPELNPEYLNFCLKTNYAKEFFLRIKTDGVSQSNINAQKLGTFEMPFCPVVEQKEIVRRVDELFALADQIEARYAKAKSYIDNLAQSILAKAFRGELLPQNPNDEPASVLLDRIKQQRDKASSKRSSKWQQAHVARA